MAMLPGFIGPSYQSESIAANSQRCVNWYLEQDPTGKASVVLYGTPGLRLLAEIDPGPIRAMERCGDGLLVLSGANLYQVAADFTANILVTLSTETGPAFIAQAGKAALVVDGSNGYSVDFSTAVWTALEVTAEGFPPNPETCTALDGYFITHTAGSQQFQISSPFDPTTWDAADFASKEAQNDPLVRVIASYRELYLVGSRTTEVWQDIGNNDFPFIRIDGAFVEQGAVNGSCTRDIDGSIMWLGQSKVGATIVWRMQGFQPVRISTHAIEQAIGSYSRIDDSYAWVYQDKGHAFYVLSFPTPGVTWCFDITTQLWHERAWRNPVTGLSEHHRGACHVFNGTHIVGDRNSGKLFALDRDVYDDDGDPMVATRTAPHLFKGGARGFLSLLEFFFEPGVGLNAGGDPQAMLRISRDGGRTYSYQRTTSMGMLGQYKHRARFQRLVNARDIVIELSISDPVKRVLIGVNAEIG